MDESKIITALETQEAKDVKTLIAFAVKKSTTLKDDEILANADQYATLIAAQLKEVAGQSPTDKEAIAAAMNILRSIAAKTSTKWDDRILSIIDMFV
jgi:hypothetical protein